MLDPLELRMRRVNSALTPSISRLLTREIASHPIECVGLLDQIARGLFDFSFQHRYLPIFLSQCLRTMCGSRSATGHRETYFVQYRDISFLSVQRVHLYLITQIDHSPFEIIDFIIFRFENILSRGDAVNPSATTRTKKNIPSTV